MLSWHAWEFESQHQKRSAFYKTSWINKYSGENDRVVFDNIENLIEPFSTFRNNNQNPYPLYCWQRSWKFRALSSICLDPLICNLAIPLPSWVSVLILLLQMLTSYTGYLHTKAYCCCPASLMPWECTWYKTGQEEIQVSSLFFYLFITYFHLLSSLNLMSEDNFPHSFLKYIYYFSLDVTVDM